MQSHSGQPAGLPVGQEASQLARMCAESWALRSVCFPNSEEIALILEVESA
jgi:hypothetical protein